MKRIVSLILCGLLIFLSLPLCMAEEARTFRILFTSDIHSHLENASRLATLLTENHTENTVYLDAGDFSQGTLYQAGYETDACELTLLARLGCLATMPGNHEWDHAGRGFATMLNSAAAKNDTLPAMLLSNADFTGNLTDEQALVEGSLSAYNEKAGKTADSRYMLYTLPNGITLGIFAVIGESSIEDAPTSGMKWTAATDSAREMVALLRDKCDFLICLSHSGTSSAQSGEDITLLETVPGIDFILSGHSHSLYHNAVTVGDATLASCGEYMQYLGAADFTVDAQGKAVCSGCRMIPITETVAEESETARLVASFREKIGTSYLAQYGYSYDQVIAHSSFSFISLGEMYDTHGEYPLGNLIADSYRYEAEKNGITDIDVFLVALGTIRGSIKTGDITVSDAFDICSLGVGGDYSAGHPLVAAYVTGKELKLVANLDATAGPMVAPIKMSYAGLRFRFNTHRTPLDQITEIKLVRPDDAEEEIDDNRLYKVCVNMYAANMLGMLNNLSKGLLTITIKDKAGNPVSDLYSCALTDKNGREIKEWVAFADYLGSFAAGETGVSEIPAKYSAPEGRKVKYTQGGWDLIANPSWITLLVIGVALLILFLIIRLIIAVIRFIVRIVRKRKHK